MNGHVAFLMSTVTGHLMESCCRLALVSACVCSVIMVEVILQALLTGSNFTVHGGSRFV